MTFLDCLALVEKEPWNLWLRPVSWRFTGQAFMLHRFSERDALRLRYVPSLSDDILTPDVKLYMGEWETVKPETVCLEEL